MPVTFNCWLAINLKRLLTRLVSLSYCRTMMLWMRRIYGCGILFALDLIIRLAGICLLFGRLDPPLVSVVVHELASLKSPDSSVVDAPIFTDEERLQLKVQMRKVPIFLIFVLENVLCLMLFNEVMNMFRL